MDCTPPAPSERGNSRRASTVPSAFASAVAGKIALGPRRNSAPARRQSAQLQLQRRRESVLEGVPEDAAAQPEQGHGREVDEHGLPTYASAAFPSGTASYRFAQAGPFAMTLSSPSQARGAGEEAAAGLGRYCISVGVNVWAPRCCVVTVRRGLTEDGPQVASIEFGSASVSMGSSLTMGETGRPLKDVVSKNLVNGARVYRVGDGSTIEWKQSKRQWKAMMKGNELAIFYLDAPRSMSLQPLGHKYFDHLVVGTLVLMREQDDAVYSRPDYGAMQMHAMY
ncbi:uncharacterized protein BXZ73DRAFT_46885 [Epithele typhae]|uniref:uncharacterized protein n=1 Tax=Epithele typhae TaxID=378194 RepID=UPI00200748C6|nr:uncharacterized protein BXZ73DRAFT_46885 [Epithele typhae]KAH9932131.1 hypothetical protein BXZ73DRAFT_46885 [Epithele typhae]